jgi:hypothetical protein
MPAAPDLSAVFRRPFAEQVAFFRGKLGNLVPTATWRDLWKSAHDRAFMVAGAAKADLLADLAAAVDKAIADGETLQGFRKRFGEIVERRGWHGWTGEETAAGRAWRTRIIYQTNLSTSYAAGRLAQLKEAGVKYWVYRHSGAEHPRLQHKLWNGLTLPADHPFWQSHYPPNGWGCGCRVVGASGPETARIAGGRPGYTEPPAGWDAIDPKTGEMVGIDKGWGYQPGATVVETVRALKSKLDKLPPEPSIALIQSWLKADAFARWFERPVGSWPLARLPDADAQALGAKDGVRVAQMSAETAAKQAARHPDIMPEDYAQAQQIVHEATAKAVYADPKSARKRIIYIKEDGRYVLIVKATQDGGELYVTTLYRLHADEARRNREIARLLRKAEKK